MRRWFMFPSFALFVAGAAAAQNTGRIMGAVTSETGQVVAGASVLVVGTGLGTLTGVDGRYTLTNVPLGLRQVRVTIIGYADLVKPATVTAEQPATVNFQLTTQAIQLQEIVTVGYGEQRRTTVTGAVASVRAQQINEIATADPVKAIQGRIPGVEIVSANNLPGAAMNIRIRGVRSLTASNEPLFVVDGIPISGGIADFNPASIRSIEVLKDAAATAIYGSRGANGVLLVTTRNGAPDVKDGVQLRFTADAQSGWARPLQLIDMMDMEQYLAMLQAAARYVGASDAVTAVLSNDALRSAYTAGRQTDWQNEILKTGQQQDFQIGVGGVSANTRFNLSAGYFNQKGLAIGQDYNRANAVLSLDHTVGRLRLGVTANGSRSVQNQGPGDGLWGYALAQTGFGAPYDTAGLLLPHPDGELLAVNPVRAQQFFLNQITRTRVFASMFGDLTLADGLHWRVNFGPDVTYQEQGIFQGSQTTYPEFNDARAQLNRADNFAYTLDNLLQLQRDLGAIHHIDATLLYGIQRSKSTNDNGSANFLPWDYQQWYALGSGPGPERNVSSRLSEWALQSFMGRASYTLLDR
ncbi:MAG: TonB-dependent receptor plug domain-containing protein, partial [Longimicrobiales bacterium]